MINSRMRSALKNSPVGSAYIVIKSILSNSKSQSNEAEVIERLSKKFRVPKTFVEFGFSGWEFNCLRLAESSQWNGLLADGVAWNVKIARKKYGRRVRTECMWIDMKTLEILKGHFADVELGVLSIDVDGNDYWFLESFISSRPAVVSAEFNVSLGLKPITVPYDDKFDRHKKHRSGEYYGASLAALVYLCSKNGYSLVETSQNGVNAFFVRDDLLEHDTKVLSVEDAYGPKYYPDGSIAPTDRFWSEIRDEDYIDVTGHDASIHSRGAPIFSSRIPQVVR